MWNKEIEDIRSARRFDIKDLTSNMAQDFALNYTWIPTHTVVLQLTEHFSTGSQMLSLSILLATVTRPVLGSILKKVAGGVFWLKMA